ncbi:MAG: hypothetical protein ABIU84_11635, partial [Thermoanaerobaculia bacterium]
RCYSSKAAAGEVPGAFPGAFPGTAIRIAWHRYPEIAWHRNPAPQSRNPAPQCAIRGALERPPLDATTSPAEEVPGAFPVFGCRLRDVKGDDASLFDESPGCGSWPVNPEDIGTSMPIQSGEKSFPADGAAFPDRSGATCP